MAELLLESLGKLFGKRPVLANFYLRVEDGAFVAIVGRSGCGKSTLLRLIAGLEAPTTGRICIDGVPLLGLNRAARMMFQEARLLPWLTVLDNVALNGERDAARAMLRRVGLVGREDDWPRTLSGGQRQRVALARALLGRPGLLLLDEPLGALDALTRLDMQRLIERLWLEQRFSALLVTHDVEEAVLLADRVVVLGGGNIVLDVAIDLPRPRRPGDGRVAARRGEILERVLEAGDAAWSLHAAEPR